MKYSLHIVKYIVVMICICSNAYLFAGCRQPQQGPPGPQGPEGPTFMASFGTWYIPGPNTVTISIGETVAFSTAEATSGITNSAGTFRLPSTGVYRITFAVLAESDSFSTPAYFDLVKNNIVVAGGEINANLFGLNPTSVIISANAGDEVLLRYVGTAPSVEIGETFPSLPPGPYSTYAYISFLQIR